MSFRGGGASADCTGRHFRRYLKCLEAPIEVSAPVKVFSNFKLSFLGDLFSQTRSLARYRFENKSPKNFVVKKRIISWIASPALAMTERNTSKVKRFKNNETNSSPLIVHSSLNNETVFSRFTSPTPAFTLAEVLITLGIIGIVAAMTLPALIHKNQNKALEAALKKNYSTISQALDMYHAQTGERIKAGEIEGRMLKTVLMKYLKSVRDCGPSFIENVCIEDYVSSPKRYKTFNNTQYFRQNLLDDGVFVLPDGSTVILENSNVNVNSGSIYISVDVNGFNKFPNKFGQDTFMFQIDNKGQLLPMGAPGTMYYSSSEEYCSKTARNDLNGAGCTYKALTDKNYWNSF